jgi:cytochrome c
MCRSTERHRLRLAALAATCILVATAAPAASYPGIGRAATPAEIEAWDIDVRPDFQGLPKGSGSVAKGQEIWEARCASCHGVFGESNQVFPPLVGGTSAEDIKTGRVKSLTSPDQGRTTFMKLATLSTLWDYVRRAMPWNAPKSLGVDEVYAVVAYMLNLADIVPADFVLDERNIAQVQAKLPNRNGMTLAHGLRAVDGPPDVRNRACMKDCPTEARLASSLPAHARDSHGNLAEQSREVGPTRGMPAAAPPDAARSPAMPVAELARSRACLGCHAVDKALVGPAFKDVAARYKGQAGAEAKLVEKVKRGGSGAWGAMAMPANPDLPQQDAVALVRWILAGGL